MSAMIRSSSVDSFIAPALEDLSLRRREDTPFPLSHANPKWMGFDYLKDLAIDVILDVRAHPRTKEQEFLAVNKKGDYGILNAAAIPHSDKVYLITKFASGLGVEEIMPLLKRISTIVNPDPYLWVAIGNLAYTLRQLDNPTAASTITQSQWDSLTFTVFGEDFWHRAFNTNNYESTFSLGEHRRLLEGTVTPANTSGLSSSVYRAYHRF
ncbi:hypothetical protein JCM6882_006264 [Rhodosporidiobolus microsporus]